MSLNLEIDMLKVVLQLQVRLPLDAVKPFLVRGWLDLAQEDSSDFPVSPNSQSMSHSWHCQHLTVYLSTLVEGRGI